MDNYDWAAWLALAIVLGVIEITTLDLIFVMLAVGALAGTGVALGTDSIMLQVIAALVTSVAMLAVVRPVALRHLRTPAAIRTGVAALVGSEAVALERVDEQKGLIKLKGEVWSARTYDPTHVIEPGRKVQVVQIDGATAVVYESEL